MNNLLNHKSFLQFKYDVALNQGLKSIECRKFWEVKYIYLFRFLHQVVSDLFQLLDIGLHSTSLNIFFESFTCKLFCSIDLY